MIIKNIKEIIVEHISDNSVKYFFLMLCFFCGIAAGAMFSASLPIEKATALTSAIDGFLTELQQKGADWHITFKNSFFGNLRIFVCLYICGFWALLVPFVYGQMLAKGFVIGFTTGFMSGFFGGRGLLFVVASVIPQCVISIPVISAMSVLSINFAIERRQLKKNMLIRKENKKDCIRYTYITLALFSFMIVSTLIDTFIIPVFIKMIGKMF